MTPAPVPQPDPAGAVSIPTLRRGSLALLLLAALLWGVDLWRPVDGRVREVWREPDVATIARNFDREGMNILAPRVDWRGDGPGLVEMEFPLYPWIIAAGYRTFGFHEEIGRLLSYGISLATLALFLALAAETLPGWGALAAGAFWVLNPLATRLANAIQPEPLMMLSLVAAVYGVRRWLVDNTWGWFAFAVLATSAAVLAKLPAIHIGMLFAAMLYWRDGMAALRRPLVWVFVGLALTPGLLWYAHAHDLWLRYGNSFGISNEYHWIGWDFFTDGSFLAGIVHNEVAAIWMPTGFILALFAWWQRPLGIGVRMASWWLAAVWIFYLAAARTTGDGWAMYYHILTLPAAALLAGAGIEAVRARFTRPDGLAWLGAAAVLATAGVALHDLYRDLHPDHYAAEYTTARQFQPLVPAGDMILASGGICEDQGHPVAYNAPYMFYWMDRKGFNICIGAQSLDAVAGFAARGARFFVAERHALIEKPGFEAELRRVYPVVSESGEAILFDLRRSGPSSALAPVHLPGPTA